MGFENKGFIRSSLLYKTVCYWCDTISEHGELEGSAVRKNAHLFKEVQAFPLKWDKKIELMALVHCTYFHYRPALIEAEALMFNIGRN